MLFALFTLFCLQLIKSMTVVIPVEEVKQEVEVAVQTESRRGSEYLELRQVLNID